MARVIDPLTPFLDNNGNIALNWSLEFYETGSSTVNKATFSNAAMTISNPAAVSIGPDGRLVNDIFGTGDYRAILRNSGGAAVRTFDPISASGSGAGSSSGFGDDWNAATPYTVGDVVRDANRYWQAQGNTTGNRPTLDSGTNWRELLLIVDNPSGPPIVDSEPLFKYRTVGGSIGAASSSTFNWQYFDPSASGGQGGLVDRPFTRVVNGLASGAVEASPEGFTVTAFTNSTVTVRNDDSANAKTVVVFGFGY